jgi:hypothetical protein
MRYAGLRLSDASSLTISQMDGNAIVVRQAKTHVNVRVPIPAGRIESKKHLICRDTKG